MFYLILFLLSIIWLGIVIIKWNPEWYNSGYDLNLVLYLYRASAIVPVSVLVLSCLYLIKPGEIGVVVNLFGSERGVDKKELTIGAHVIWPWESLYLFPTFEQNHQWVGNEGFLFQTSEGLSVKADIGITFNLIPNKIHELFYKYRRGMEEITHLFIRNNVRDAINREASKMRIEELYGPKKEDFFSNIHSSVQKELEPLGFNISRLYIVGQFEVPNTVLDALNKKIEATQRAQQRENELREAEAQAKKEVAIKQGEAQAILIKAEADAKANEKVSKSLTSELLEWQAINKWDGKLPDAMAGDNMPFLIQLGTKK
jgi:regulator of protease activity HflC (stomatin/prohibitin superfamily)